MLTDFFERVYVVNLKKRADRRRALISEFDSTGMADPGAVHWFEAIDGEELPEPAWWARNSRGGWGCLMSHVRIAQDCWQDGVANYLVLEDDVIFHQHSRALLERFMKVLPPNWDMAYLGGQHNCHGNEHLSHGHETGLPKYLKKGLCQGRRINRTHAFALNRPFIPRFLQHVFHFPDYRERNQFHIDHQLELLHMREEAKVYCPQWWIAGQGAGKSDVNHEEQSAKWWMADIRENIFELPLVVVGEDLASQERNTLRQMTNAELRDFKDADRERDRVKVLETHGRRALNNQKLPAVKAINAPEIVVDWPGDVMHWPVDASNYFPCPAP